MRVADISRSSLPTRWRQKSTGIDTKQNDVIVTLCVVVVKGLTALRLFISFSQLKIYCGAGYVLFVELVVSSLTTKVIINANLFGLFLNRNKQRVVCIVSGMLEYSLFGFSYVSLQRNFHSIPHNFYVILYLAAKTKLQYVEM